MGVEKPYQAPKKKRALNERLPQGRHYHGFDLPLFWVSSPTSCGIGDFRDLRQVIDWCGERNWQILQLLPLCDTWEEPSPYSAICSLAINWIYLDVTPWMNASDRQRADELNRLPRIAHGSIRALKRAVLERAIATGRFWREADGFVINHPWVNAYARFCTYKELLNSSPWWTWPQLNESTAAFNARSRFYRVAQYLAYGQLREIKAYAQTRRVLLKGDLPILMQRDSCDVWRNGDWFDPMLEVGAPPDAYSSVGQNWGFPPCQWPAMHAGGFAWWRERLKAADTCFHLYRLDHIAGFFRLWCIPNGEPGYSGRYLPASEAEWERVGRQNLTALLALGKALPIGEDLGQIPPVVRRVMDELGIPGTKVMRWERTWDSAPGFLNPADYPECSMTCVSTHDSTTLAQWWGQTRDESELYAKQRGLKFAPELSPDNRFAILLESHRSNSRLHVNLLAEYLPLFPDLAPGVAHQRINDPALQGPDNWSRRCPVVFDEIAAHLGLAGALAELRRIDIS